MSLHVICDEMRIINHEKGERSTGHSSGSSDYRILCSQGKVRIVSVKDFSNKETKPHSHSDREEVYIILSGKARVQVLGDEKTVGPGDVVVFERGEDHSLVCLSPAIHFLSVNALD